MTKSKKDETSKPAFDWEKALYELEISRMLKRGVEEYIKSNDLTVDDEKDLEKVLKDFKELNLGA